MAGRPKPIALQLLSAPKKARAKMKRMAGAPMPVEFVDPEYPPESLPPEVHAIWSEQARNLPRKLVGRESIEMFAAYCMAVYQHREIAKRVLKEPPMLEGGVDSQGKPRDPRPNPVWVEYRRIAETIRKLLCEMGLTPTSIYRTRPRQQDSEQKSEWQVFD